MDCGTRKLDIVSDTGVLRKKSLFYGRVEAYFAVYDSVVLTGPFRLPAFAFWPSCTRCGLSPLLRLDDWRMPDHNGIVTFRIGKKRRASWPLYAGSRAPSPQSR